MPHKAKSLTSDLGPGPYHLLRGVDELGGIERLAPGIASGWLEGTLQPSAAWPTVAPLFAGEAAALRHADRWPDAWQTAWDAAQGPGVTLRDRSGANWPVDVHVDALTVRLQLR